jgi:hypothetical protein
MLFQKLGNAVEKLQNTQLLLLQNKGIVVEQLAQWENAAVNQRRTQQVK